ncbi:MULTISPECIES: hypothetical protein [unclassified Mesorhizobium]|nr:MULTISPECIES: hypothetical protein [unclassified Mesorhizobium]
MRTAVIGHWRTDAGLARQSFEHTAQQIVFQEKIDRARFSGYAAWTGR